MKFSRYVPSPEDVARTIEYLERTLDPKNTVYDIGRITNDEHGLNPHGEGFSIMVKFWFRQPGVPGHRLQRFWEKAGDGATCYEAAMQAVKRLSAFQEQLEKRAHD